MIYFCIDESGSFNNWQERYYIISGIIIDNPQKLVKIHQEIKREICQKKKCRKEIKSTNINDEQQSEFINEMTKRNYQIVSLVIDKLALESKTNFDITEFFIYNYALKELIKHALELGYLSNIDKLICLVDKREMKPVIQNELEGYLNLEYFHQFKIIKVYYKDSATNPEIQMADYISNAVYGYLHQSNEVYEMIKNKKRIKIKIIPDKKKMI